MLSCSNIPSSTLAAELSLEQGQDQGQYSQDLQDVLFLEKAITCSPTNAIHLTAFSVWPY